MSSVISPFIQNKYFWTSDEKNNTKNDELWISISSFFLCNFENCLVNMFGHFWYFFYNILYFWPRNINIHIPKMNVASMKNSGSPFLGSNVLFFWILPNCSCRCSLNFVLAVNQCSFSGNHGSEQVALRLNRLYGLESKLLHS